jgi:hypothetical protein
MFSLGSPPPSSGLALSFCTARDVCRNFGQGLSYNEQDD